MQRNTTEKLHLITEDCGPDATANRNGASTYHSTWPRSASTKNNKFRLRLLEHCSVGWSALSVRCLWHPLHCQTTKCGQIYSNSIVIGSTYPPLRYPAAFPLLPVFPCNRKRKWQYHCFATFTGSDRKGFKYQANNT